ncbi:hypothetical protein RF55_1499 [Lasius niger]|uniref:Uncharacterized protein n=1 Tax=Lasius niger TaxID=67767 RepID=A0A0J7P0J2_LASNI|nr:hypothetical protein RF55_1499 [Lasius niger]
MVHRQLEFTCAFGEIIRFDNEIFTTSQCGRFSQFIRSESFLFSTSRNTVEEADGAPSLSIDPAPLNMAPGVAFVLSLILVIGHLQEGPGSLAKTFTFPEYPYKETTKNVSWTYNSSDLSLTSGTCLNADTGYGEQPSFKGVALLQHRERQH